MACGFAGTVSCCAARATVRAQLDVVFDDMIVLPQKHCVPDESQHASAKERDGGRLPFATPKYVMLLVRHALPHLSSVRLATGTSCDRAGWSLEEP